MYGERNTGTNYLAELITLNLGIEQLPGTEPRWLDRMRSKLRAEWLVDLWFRFTQARNLGWKHSSVRLPPEVVQRFDGRLVVVALVKNPYSWVLSLWRRPYHNKKRTRALPSIHRFVQTPWPALWRDLAGGNFTSPVDIWNRKTRSYLEVSPDVPFVLVQYEDLLQDPEREIRRIAAAAGVSAPASFHNLASGVKRRDAEASFSRYRQYYLEEKWRDELDKETVREITRRLDPEVVRRAGYELL